jgi:hypothetical protein
MNAALVARLLLHVTFATTSWIVALPGCELLTNPRTERRSADALFPITAMFPRLSGSAHFDRLYNRLQGVLGPDEASSLMSLLPSVGWADVATKQDLVQLEQRLDAGFEAKLSRLESKMFRTILIANSASLLTMAGLAFAAARLI